MEHQYRRGIYRPNAQRLSISLAPLVAQRSLLFRIQADLATKTHYAELTPTDSSSSGSISPSSGLFVVTASARILSAALSALSTCSVYSQESWQGASPFAPAPTRALASLFLNMDDTRRHAIAFSPSVQWEALSEDSDSSGLGEESVIKTPLQSAPAVPTAASVSSPQIGGEHCEALTKREQLRLSTNSSIFSPFFRGETQSPKTLKSVIEEQAPVKSEDLSMEEVARNASLNLKKRDSAAKRISKHAKAFGKAIGHLSMQPNSKKDATETPTMGKGAIRRQTTVPVISHPHLSHADYYKYKLPDVPRRMSPIRMSFIAKVSNATGPAALQLAAVSLAGDSAVPGQIDTNVNAQSILTRPRPPRSMRPSPTPSNSSSHQIQIQRSITPPPVLPIQPYMPVSRKGHRRYNSSPAVPNFKAMEFKGWDRADMPPLPAMPPFVALRFELGATPPPRPPRSRARSDGDVGNGTMLTGRE